MTDQTVPSLTDRLAGYLVNAYVDGRGYDPGDKTDVEVTLKEGFHTVLTEMREDQAAGTATYDGLLPSPPPGEPESESFREDDGWDVGECECGWVSPPCPGRDIVADFYAEHIAEEGTDG